MIKWGDGVEVIPAHEQELHKMEDCSCDPEKFVELGVPFSVHGQFAPETLRQRYERLRIEYEQAVTFHKGGPSAECSARWEELESLKQVLELSEKDVRIPGSMAP